MFVGLDTGSKTAASSGMGRVSFHGIFDWPKNLLRFLILRKNTNRFFMANPMFHSVTNLKKMVSENLIFDYILVLSYLFG